MTYVLGVDEAGRGPLAGPVAVGAVLAPRDFAFERAFPGLNDSKKLSEKKREELYALLCTLVEEGALHATVCFSSEKVIDTSGIAYAVRDALTRAIETLAPDPQQVHVLLDGSLHAPRAYTQETIIGGDAKEPAIMLASVAAKVVRDRVMKTLAKEYPAYGFEVHKGYGTKMHRERIRLYGLSPVHRRSFIHLS